MADIPMDNGAHLDAYTVSFNASNDLGLRPGDTLVVREIQQSKMGFEVAVVPERAVRAEAERLLRG